jgi:hypothetical protein
MVSCSECVNHNVECFYDRDHSVACAECLKHQRTCDGTFSVEVLRKVGEQKKRLQLQARAKRDQLLVLRRAQLALEEEDAALHKEIAALEERTSAMLRREMQALNALGPIGNEREVAMGDEFLVWPGPGPCEFDFDWDQALDGIVGMPEGPPGGVLG